MTDLDKALSEPPAAADDIRDALMDSQYLAGVTAGWNAAQADNPEEALARLKKSRRGYLAPITRARRDKALSEPPAAQYRHKKRGTTYTYVGPALLQTDALLSDMAELVIYRSMEGELWARPPSEFNDGRFEQVAPATLSEPPAALAEIEGLVERLRDQSLGHRHYGKHATASFFTQACDALETLSAAYEREKQCYLSANERAAEIDAERATAEARVAQLEAALRDFMEYADVDATPLWVRENARTALSTEAKAQGGENRAC